MSQCNAYRAVPPDGAVWRCQLPLGHDIPNHYAGGLPNGQTFEWPVDLAEYDAQRTRYEKCTSLLSDPGGGQGVARCRLAAGHVNDHYMPLANNQWIEWKDGGRYVVRSNEPTCQSQYVINDKHGRALGRVKCVKPPEHEGLHSDGNHIGARRWVSAMEGVHTRIVPRQRTKP